MNLALMIGLWIVTIATVPLYYLWKMYQRKICKHEYKNYRICSACGIREKAIEVKSDTAGHRAGTKEVLESV